MTCWRRCCCRQRCWSSEQTTRCASGERYWKCIRDDFWMFLRDYYAFRGSSGRLLYWKFRRSGNILLIYYSAYVYTDLMRRFPASLEQTKPLSLYTPRSYPLGARIHLLSFPSLRWSMASSVLFCFAACCFRMPPSSVIHLGIYVSSFCRRPRRVW